MLESRVREKDQELKLAEMRIKELSKSIPHKKLRPLESRSVGRRSSHGMVRKAEAAVTDV